MSVTLYREIDALGGAADTSTPYNNAHDEGYSAALSDVLVILSKRGFSEAEDAQPEALIALAHQYRSDMLYPPAADSRVRRIEAIDAVLFPGRKS
ncbi:hypothetical protein [Novosphingobium sp. Leaf2]|uniref:hypothetical protein n=1 Tax=Novosphingobium sp. Leaf2 TaxID=1735670 RepID=UPI0006F74018|nr:hypothetical protein [Novosphingobium sp. Leaf2]KQM18407.1 hypothetical protein ASE49_09355 [Novosphingobium sp. Leaf2]